MFQESMKHAVEAPAGRAATPSVYAYCRHVAMRILILIASVQAICVPDLRASAAWYHASPPQARIRALFFFAPRLCVCASVVLFGGVMCRAVRVKLLFYVFCVSFVLCG